MVTITTTIRDPVFSPYLEQRAYIHQKVLRKLFVAIYIEGENPNEAYNRLAAAHGIFAAEINSVRKETEAIYASWQELLDVRITDQERKVRRLDEKLKACGKQAKAQGKVHQWKRKLQRFRLQLEALKQERASGIPRICFGSKELFHKQFHPKENGYKSHAEWRADWREARGRAFYLAGRARERSGNAACIMEVLNASTEALTCILRLRKKNNEIAGRKAKPGDYIPIPVKFTYNHQYLLAALEAKRPITYRFIREPGAWKVQAAVELPEVPVITDARNGSIGVDQNPLCLAAALVKPDGNQEDTLVFKLTQGHRTAPQTEYELSQVVCTLVALAVATKRPLVIESLDFKQLQRELKSRGLNRLLSRFKYGLFHKLLYGRAAKFGVEILEVNPAYSSLIGWLKFGYGYGLSRHQAAALAIGRRILRPATGKPFSERICARVTPQHPGARQLSRTASTKPVRKRTEHDWTGWRRLRGLWARDPSKSGVPGPRSRHAASRHEAWKQGIAPYPSGRPETPVETDASKGGSKRSTGESQGNSICPRVT